MNKWKRKLLFQDFPVFRTRITSTCNLDLVLLSVVRTKPLRVVAPWRRFFRIFRHDRDDPGTVFECTKIEMP